MSNRRTTTRFEGAGRPRNNRLRVWGILLCIAVALVIAGHFADFGPSEMAVRDTPPAQQPIAIDPTAQAPARDAATMDGRETDGIALVEKPARPSVYDEVDAEPLAHTNREECDVHRGGL